MAIMEKRNVASVQAWANRKPKALVVDDSEKVRKTVSVLLKRSGIQPVLAGNAAAAMERFLEEDFDLVVTDLDMPGTNGLELIRWLRTRKPFLPVIIVPGNPPGDEEAAMVVSVRKF